MLVVTVKDTEWIEIRHRSGDVLRLRAYGYRGQILDPHRANFAFDDAERNFEVSRIRGCKADANLACPGDSSSSASEAAPEAL